MSLSNWNHAVSTLCLASCTQQNAMLLCVAIVPSLTVLHSQSCTTHYLKAGTVGHSLSLVVNYTLHKIYHLNHFKVHSSAALSTIKYMVVHSSPPLGVLSLYNKKCLVVSWLLSWSHTLLLSLVPQHRLVPYCDTYHGVVQCFPHCCRWWVIRSIQWASIHVLKIGK